MHQRHAYRVTDFIEQACVDAFVEVVVRNEQECDAGPDVNQNYAQHGRHQKLAQIGGHGQDDVLERWESVYNVEQVEWVEHWRLYQSLHTEHIVNNEKDELPVTNQEWKTDPVVLEGKCHRAKLSLLRPFVPENSAEGTFNLKDDPVCGNIQVVDFKFAESEGSSDLQLLFLE